MRIYDEEKRVRQVTIVMEGDEADKLSEEIYSLLAGLKRRSNLNEEFPTVTTLLDLFEPEREGAING